MMARLEFGYRSVRGCKAAIILLALAAAAAPADAQVNQTYVYDVHGRLVATTTAPASGGSLTRYDLSNSDNRTSRVSRLSVVRAVQDELRSGESLLPTQSIRSLDNRFTFLLQLDGNAVLSGPGVAWSTNTHGSGAIALDMQTDGNAGLRNAAWSAIWQSSTNGNPGAFFKVRNDGNLVILSGSTVLWQSGTCCH